MMGKYVLELIKGDDRTVLEVCDTNEEAFNKGVQYRNQYKREQGLIGCILASVDENGNVDRERYKIVHCWN